MNHAILLATAIVSACIPANKHAGDPARDAEKARRALTKLDEARAQAVEVKAGGHLRDYATTLYDVGHEQKLLSPAEIEHRAAELEGWVDDAIAHPKGIAWKTGLSTTSESVQLRMKGVYGARAALRFLRDDKQGALAAYLEGTDKGYDTWLDAVLLAKDVTPGEEAQICRRAERVAAKAKHSEPRYEVFKECSRLLPGSTFDEQLASWATPAEVAWYRKEHEWRIAADARNSARRDGERQVLDSMEMERKRAIYEGR